MPMPDAFPGAVHMDMAKLQKAERDKSYGGVGAGLKSCATNYHQDSPALWLIGEASFLMFNWDGGGSR